MNYYCRLCKKYLTNDQGENLDIDFLVHMKAYHDKEYGSRIGMLFLEFVDITKELR